MEPREDENKAEENSDNITVESSDEKQVEYEEDIEVALGACMSSMSQVSLLSVQPSDSSHSSDEINDGEDTAGVQLKDPTVFTQDYQAPSLEPPQVKETSFLTSFECKLHQSLVGMTYVNDDLMILGDENIVLRRDHRDLDNHVKILTGGKAGLDPLYTGYVGKGMLTGAVVGSLRDVPKTSTILQAIRELSYNHKKGIIIIILNDLEERMNFGLAMERARTEGILIDMITVGDDAAEKVSRQVGRRGLAGITLIYKIAGSMSEARQPMVDIFTMCRSLATMSLVTISARIGKGMCIGTSIDGHKGLQLKTKSFNSLVNKMIYYLINPLAYFSLKMVDGADIVILLNVYNQDIPLLNYIACEVIPVIGKKYHITRVYPGHFVNGPPGFSISVMHCCSDEVLNWLDKLPQMSVWPRPKATGRFCVQDPLEVVPKRPTLLGPVFADENDIISTVKVICRDIRESEDYLNEMDPFGEFGSQITKATKMIELRIRENTFQCARPFNMLSEMSEIVEASVLGLTGTYLSILFAGAAQAFLIYPSFETVSNEMWTKAINGGLTEVHVFANLSKGSCGFIDALEAAYNAMLKYVEIDVRSTLFKGTEAANDFCTTTREKKSSAIKPGYPDVTAYAAVIILRSLYSTVYVG